MLFFLFVLTKKLAHTANVQYSAPSPPSFMSGNSTKLGLLISIECRCATMLHMSTDLFVYTVCEALLPHSGCNTLSTENSIGSLRSFRRDANSLRVMSYLTFALFSSVTIFSIFACDPRVDDWIASRLTGFWFSGDTSPAFFPSKVCRAVSAMSSVVVMCLLRFVAVLAASTSVRLFRYLVLSELPVLSATN